MGETVVGSERAAVAAPQSLDVFRPRYRAGDRLFSWALTLSTWTYLGLIVALFVVLFAGSWLAIKSFGLRFLVGSSWDPVAGHFGALPFIFGTVVSSAIAIVIASGVGIAAAAYLAEFAPPLIARPLAFLIELLAAVPSVVYGLWGLFVLAPLVRSVIGPAIQSKLGWLPIFSGPIYGVGMLTASLILALMIVPTVAAISRDFIESVAVDQREAMLALGATRWETVRRVVLPAARPGIFGACVLALGRALGETIATTMVIGNRPAISASLFAPGYTLASVIANEFTEATTQVYISTLIGLGLLLFVVSIVVNAAARILMHTVLRNAEER